MGILDITILLVYGLVIIGAIYILYDAYKVDKRQKPYINNTPLWYYERRPVENKEPTEADIEKIEEKMRKRLLEALEKADDEIKEQKSMKTIEDFKKILMGDGFIFNDKYENDERLLTIAKNGEENLTVVLEINIQTKAVLIVYSDYDIENTTHIRLMHKILHLSTLLRMRNKKGSEANKTTENEHEDNKEDNQSKIKTIEDFKNKMEDYGFEFNDEYERNDRILTVVKHKELDITLVLEMNTKENMVLIIYSDIDYRNDEHIEIMNRVLALMNQLSRNKLLEKKINEETISKKYPNHYYINGRNTLDIIKDIVNNNAKSINEGVYLFNVLKYLIRYRHKNKAEDLKKSKNYLEWLIKEVEKED
ncbi:DUF3310 domain-containing protein [Peptoniphilus sp. MSJ-1]|uniref:DUF3310 domain-containing protein n=1 Tax=Peptoniphilus ovalis TaxID=2841503 RepID=A0ABS6FHT7_9FIRM|nr:DUF3310 domain-containing protein [Peptoniphilus ovalis]MBU5669536.1 DUF3310 domain-containing protein [Peptoniphilus ovalis]